MESDDVRGSTRGRGRIAEVLAEARASLKEPSRPFTPASLDARTSIDVKTLDRFGRGPLAKHPSFGRLPDDYYQPPVSSSRTQSFEDLDLPGRAAAKRRSSKTATSSSSSSAPSSLSGPASEVCGLQVAALPRFAQHPNNVHFHSMSDASLGPPGRVQTQGRAGAPRRTAR